MANSRTTSEFWDGTEEEFQHELHYPNATPRRALFAHALGILNVLGTLALAAFAFAPRMGKLGTLFLKDEPAQYPAKPIAQVPAAQPSVTNIEVAPPLPVAPIINAPEPPIANVAPTVALPESTEPTGAAVGAPTVAPAETATAVPGATSVPALAAPAAPDAAADQTPPKAVNSAAESAKAAPARAAVVTRRAAREEPPMTQREIERRKQRYEAWLKDQGLEPVH